jgi:hypothetical protein
MEDTRTKAKAMGRLPMSLGEWASCQTVSVPAVLGRTQSLFMPGIIFDLETLWGISLL